MTSLSADLARVADERVAALGAADAADEAGPAQRRQQLVQVGLRDPLARGDLAALHRARLTVVVRQLDEGADAVVALGGDTFHICLDSEFASVNNHNIPRWGIGTGAFRS